MGGGGADHPAGIWSPAGGWHADPRSWRRGTAVVALAMAAAAAYVFRGSAALETRHAAPARPIPSRRWANVPAAGAGPGGSTAPRGE